MIKVSWEHYLIFPLSYALLPIQYNHPDDTLTQLKVRTFPEIDARTETADELGLTQSQRTHRSTIQGISVASYNLGCFLGACTCIKVGDMLGRRKTIFMGSAIMVVGAALQCSAYSLSHLIIGRIITGIGNGFNTSTVPTWQSECSKSHRRGQLVMVEGALITGGVCFSYWLDFGFSFLDPNSIAWRFPIGFQIFFALVILSFVHELPESPRWLVLKGKEDEALNVLGALSDLPSDDPYIWGEFQAIKDTVIENQKAGGLKDLFTMGPDRHLHRTCLAYVNQMFQQISGINLITYYAATIYQNQIGLDPLTSRILAAANGTEYFLASWIAVFTIEKSGRRRLMLLGAAGMSFSMAMLAIMSYLGGKGPGVVAALFLFIFNTFFAVGWLVVMITPISFASIQYKTYVIFAVIKLTLISSNAALFPAVWFFYPETAYRSLEEMDSIFRKCNSIFTIVKIAKDEPQRYGENGELLIRYEETEEHRQRQVSRASNPAIEKVGENRVEDADEPRV
ncbi:MAG: hypothetical protein Q9177_003271 [Variospora cf. flavescens]